MLVKRKEIATNKKVIGSELVRFQELLLEVEDLTWLENKNHKKEYLKRYDLLDLPKIEIPSFNKVLGISHKNINNFTEKLSEKLMELLNDIGVSQLIIITPLKVDFFGNRDNKYKPLQESYEKLEVIVNDKTYNEAIKIESIELGVFIEIFFWIVRCDPSASDYFFFYDNNEQIEFNICKYGNIHITEFGKEIIKDCNSFSNNWIEIKGEEFDNFTEDGRIEGRRLKL